MPDTAKASSGAEKPKKLTPAEREEQRARNAKRALAALQKRGLRAAPGCSVVTFWRKTRGSGKLMTPVVTERCRDRKLQAAERCHAGGAQWRAKVRANFAQGLTVATGAFEPARLIACRRFAENVVTKENRDIPARPAPRPVDCALYDVRVHGERVASFAHLDEAKAEATKLARKEKTVWVAPGCRASQIFWRP